MCTYMYITYIYAYVCVCVCVCVCVYMYIHACTHACMCVCMYVCMYVCTCMYVCMLYICMLYVCMYVCMYVRTVYVCTCMYVVCTLYVCMYVCMYYKVHSKGCFNCILSEQFHNGPGVHNHRKSIQVPVLLAWVRSIGLRGWIATSSSTMKFRNFTPDYPLCSICLFGWIASTARWIFQV